MSAAQLQGCKDRAAVLHATLDAIRGSSPMTILPAFAWRGSSPMTILPAFAWRGGKRDLRPN